MVTEGSMAMYHDIWYMPYNNKFTIPPEIEEKEINKEATFKEDTIFKASHFFHWKVQWTLKEGKMLEIFIHKFWVERVEKETEKMMKGKVSLNPIVKTVLPSLSLSMSLTVKHSLTLMSIRKRYFLPLTTTLLHIHKRESQIKRWNEEKRRVAEE